MKSKTIGKPRPSNANSKLHRERLRHECETRRLKEQTGERRPRRLGFMQQFFMHIKGPEILNLGLEVSEKTVLAVMVVFADCVRTWAVVAVYMFFARVVGENVFHYFDPNGHIYSHLYRFQSYLDEGFLMLALFLSSFSLCNQLGKIYFRRRRTDASNRSDDDSS